METTHVFLDTEVFDSNNFYFDSSVFRRLVELVEERTINVHLTTITVREIEAHIVSYIEQGIKDIKALQKERTVKVVGLIPDTPFQLIPKQFDIELLKQRLLDSFHMFLRAVRANIIPVEGVSIEGVFDKYFGVVAPFGSGEKKHEFPDAFALAGLDYWCEQNDSAIFVISNDNDMHNACEVSESLISLKSVHELFDVIAREQTELYEFALGLFNQHKGEIEELLRDNFPDLMLFIDMPESEVFDVEILSLEIDKELAIEVRDDHATFDLDVEVEIRAEITYADLIVEDVPVLMHNEDIEKTLYMKAKVNLLYDHEDPDAFQVEYANFDDDSLLLDIEPSAYDLK